MSIRLVQIVNGCGDNEGIAETNLTDTQIDTAISIFEDEKYNDMDIFEKIREYSENEKMIFERKFVEIYNLN